MCQKGVFGDWLEGIDVLVRKLRTLPISEFLDKKGRNAEKFS